MHIFYWQISFSLSVYNKTNYWFLKLYSCHRSTRVLLSYSVLFASGGRSSGCLCNLINPRKVLNVISRGEEKRNARHSMAHHLLLCGHAQHFHAENQQPISYGISPMCRHANTGSYTCTLEQTGTTQACEYRRREERYVALSLPHTRRDQD